MSPQRIQRKRTKGWRMPEEAVYVGRPSRWGNPFQVVRCGGDEPGWRVRGGGESTQADNPPWTRWEAAEYAVERFERTIRPTSVRGRQAQIELAGRDLACWCPLDWPCHADVLLRIANFPDT